MNFYEKKKNVKNKRKATRVKDLKPEHQGIYSKLLKFCSSNPQKFWNIASAEQTIETLHDNEVKKKPIPYTPTDEQEIKKHVDEFLALKLIEASISH